MIEGYYTTAEAAKEIGCSDAHIRNMIISGRISSQKAGHIHMIPENEVRRIKEEPYRTGRPRKHSVKAA